MVGISLIKIRIYPLAGFGQHSVCVALSSFARSRPLNCSRALCSSVDDNHCTGNVAYLLPLCAICEGKESGFSDNFDFGLDRVTKAYLESYDFAFYGNSMPCLHPGMKIRAAQTGRVKARLPMKATMRLFSPTVNRLAASAPSIVGQFRRGLTFAVLYRDRNCERRVQWPRPFLWYNFRGR